MEGGSSYDTGKNRLQVYVRDGDGFKKIQTVEKIGIRPHRIRYDETTRAFYVTSSNSQDITKLVSSAKGLRVAYTKNLPYLKGQYTRSFTIIDSLMYIVSGPSKINAVNYKDDSYSIIKSYAVPTQMSNMNDIFKIDYNKYFITSTNASGSLIITNDLDNIKFINNKSSLGITQVPYYITEFDGKFWLPEIGIGENGIISFSADDLAKKEMHFHSGQAIAQDKKVCDEEPR